MSERGNEKSETLIDFALPERLSQVWHELLLFAEEN